MGLFPNGVTYKKGGVAGAFRNVKVNENENQALYQVKGKRSVIIYHESKNLLSGQVDSARIMALRNQFSSDYFQILLDIWYRNLG